MLLEGSEKQGWQGWLCWEDLGLFKIEGQAFAELDLRRCPDISIAQAEEPLPDPMIWPIYGKLKLEKTQTQMLGNLEPYEVIALNERCFSGSVKFQRVWDTEPHPMAVQWQAEWQAFNYVVQAEKLFRENLSDAALDSIEKAIALAPHRETWLIRAGEMIGTTKNPDMRKMSLINQSVNSDKLSPSWQRSVVAYHWFYLGHRAWKKDCLQNAFSFYQEALKFNEQILLILESAAFTAKKLNRPDETVYLFKRAADVAISTGYKEQAQAFMNEIKRLRSPYPPWVFQLTNQNLELTYVLNKFWHAHSLIPSFCKDRAFEEATYLAKESLMMIEKRLGDSHPIYFLALFDLGIVYQTMGQYGESELLFGRALRLCEEIFGARHLTSIHMLNNLAESLRCQNRYEKAEPLYERALRACEILLGTRHPETLMIMHNLANLYTSQGRYQEAESLNMRVLCSREEVLGFRHPETLKSMSNLAYVYAEQSRFVVAESLLKRALSVHEETLGERHPDTHIMLNNLASLYASQGRFKKAESFYENAYGVLEELLGLHHPQVLGLLNNRACLYSMWGRYEEAEHLYVRVLRVQEEQLGRRHPETLLSINNLAQLHVNQGRYLEAELLFERSLRACEEVLGPCHRETLGSMNSLAHLYFLQGRFGEAETLFEQVQKKAEEMLGARHQISLTILNNLAELYLSQGRFGEAEPMAERGLQLREEMLGARHPDTLNSLNTLAQIYRSEGRFEEAELLIWRALDVSEDVLGAHHPDTLVILTNLAQLKAHLGLYGEAESLYKKVLRRQEEGLDAHHPHTLATLNSLASLFHSEGRFEEAEPVYERALSGREVALGERHPETLSSLNNLAMLYQSQGRYGEAEPLYERALSAYKAVLGDRHPVTFSTVNNLAILKSDSGELVDADLTWQQSLRIYSTFLKILGGMDQTTQRIFLNKQGPYRDIYLSYFSQRPLSISAQSSLQFSLVHKAVLFGEAFRGQNAQLQTSEPDLSHKVVVLQRLRRDYAAFMLRRSSDIDPEQFLKKRSELERNIRNLEGELSLQMIGSTRGKGVDLEKIRESIGPGQVFIDFHAYQYFQFPGLIDCGERMMALVVDPSRQPWVTQVDLGALGPVREVTAALREATQKQRSLIITEHAQKLYELVWQPLEGHLFGKDQVYLSSDGPLHLLPFALLDNRAGYKPAQQHRLVMMSSARDLIHKTNQSPQTQPQLFFYPDYQGSITATKPKVPGSQGYGFSPLKWTAREGKVIQKTMEDYGYKPEVFQAITATEAAISNIESPEILHIASHGQYKGGSASPGFGRGGQEGPGRNLSPFRGLRDSFTLDQEETQWNPSIDDPMLKSGIALAGVNTAGVTWEDREHGTDGFLTALEAQSLNLRGTRLVVLSACDTGLGDLQSGEGVYGLTRAFRLAGAQAVLATLWAVDDEATSVFMGHFYDHFLQTDDPVEALSQAREAMLKDPRWQDPFYWAPFFLIGE